MGASGGRRMWPVNPHPGQRRCGTAPFDPPTWHIFSRLRSKSASGPAASGMGHGSFAQLLYSKLQELTHTKNHPISMALTVSLPGDSRRIPPRLSRCDENPEPVPWFNVVRKLEGFSRLFPPRIHATKPGCSTKHSLDSSHGGDDLS